MTPLEELVRATLHDPARELSPAPGSIDVAIGGVTTMRLRRLTITLALGLAGVALVTLGVVIAGPDADNSGPPADGREGPMPTVASIRDADVVQRILLPGNGVAYLTMDADAIYVANGSTGPAGPFLLRVDRSAGRIVAKRTVAAEPVALALGPADSLWVATAGEQPADYALLQLDRRTLAIRRTVRLVPYPATALAVTDGTLWVGSEGTLYRLNAVDGRVQARLQPGRPVFSVTVDPSHRLLLVGLRDELTAALLVLDERTGRQLARRALHGPPMPAAGSVWMAESGSEASRIRRLDPRTLADLPAGEVGRLRDEGFAAWAGGSVLWVTNARRSQLMCVDPASGGVLGIRRLETGALVADDTALYAADPRGLVRVAPASVCRG